MFTKKSTILANSVPKVVKTSSFRIEVFNPVTNVELVRVLPELEKATAFCCNLFPLITSNLRIVERVTTSTNGEESSEDIVVASFLHEPLSY